MGLLRVRKVVIPAHFLPYSTLKGEYTRGKIEYHIGSVHHMNRDEVRFITRTHPTFEKELELRAKLGVTPYDISIILVVEEIPTNKIEILCQSKTYSDVKEVLIVL
jgi:hypothetical protein